jgi:hypothetical protein
MTIEPSTTTQTREPQQIEGFPIPAGGWVCFHCNEAFTTREGAAEHFGNGDYEDETPLCIVAATTEQKQLILTNREMWDELQKARQENGDLEDRLSGFEYTARKLTKKPHATTHDLEHEWDFMEGRVVAAESHAPSDTEQRLRQMLAEIVDANYGTAVENIGSGDGVSAELAAGVTAECRRYWYDKFGAYPQFFEKAEQEQEK